MAFRLKVHKRYRALVTEALERGWTLTTNGKHPKLTSPDGKTATPIPSADPHGLYSRFRKVLTTHPSFTDDEPID